MALDDKLRVRVLHNDMKLPTFLLKPFFFLSSTGPEVGIAWLGQVCNTGAVSSGVKGQTTSGTGVSSISKSIFFYRTYKIGALC